MGAGKTTLGAPLAEALNLSFIDLDKFIEQRYHKTVGKIFADCGEEQFREIERNVLLEVSQFEDAVISTGGGTPCFFDNMEVMEKTGLTVFLEVSIPVLFARLKHGKQKRPILKDKNDIELLQFIKDSLDRRIETYKRCQIHFNADQLESDCQVEESVQQLIKLLR